jgi:hypothetical protein
VTLRAIDTGLPLLFREVAAAPEHFKLSDVARPADVYQLSGGGAGDEPARVGFSFFIGKRVATVTACTAYIGLRVRAAPEKIDRLISDLLMAGQAAAAGRLRVLSGALRRQGGRE